MTKIIYTKSGNRYLLDQENMRWTEKLNGPDIWLDLLEWPDLEVGKPLKIVYKNCHSDLPRIVVTSEVLGFV